MASLSSSQDSPSFLHSTRMRFRSKMRKPMAGLQFETGQSAGVYIPLDAGEYLLCETPQILQNIPEQQLPKAARNAYENLIVYGLGDTCAILKIGSFAEAKLTLITGSVTLNKHSLRIGQQKRLKHTDIIAFENIEFSFHNNTKSYKKGIAVTGASLAAAWMLLQPLPQYRVFSSVPQTNSNTQQSLLAHPTYNAMQAAGEFNAFLAENGLENVTATAPQNASVVLVQGPEGTRNSPAWLAAREWFELRWAESLALDARFEKQQTPIVLPFELRSIWDSERPVLIINNGNRYFVGDTLPGGWKIERIHSKGAVIAQNNMVIDISL